MEMGGGMFSREGDGGIPGEVRETHGQTEILTEGWQGGKRETKRPSDREIRPREAKRQKDRGKKMFTRTGALILVEKKSWYRDEGK